MFKSFAEKISSARHQLSGRSQDTAGSEYPSHKIDNYFLPKGGVLNAIINMSPPPGPPPHVDNVHTIVLHALQFGAIDYEVVLKYCKDVGKSSIVAKDAAHELAVELESGFPSRKCVALSLLVTMSGNTGDSFIEHITSQKFVKIVDGVLGSESLPTYTKALALRATSIFTHEAHTNSAFAPYNELYQKYKSPSDPAAGIAASPSEDIFYPALPRTRVDTQTARGPREIRDLHMLDAHINIAEGNADLLKEAMGYTGDADWATNDLLHEFRDRTVTSHKMLSINEAWLRDESSADSSEGTRATYRKLTDTLAQIDAVLRAYDERAQTLQ